MSIHEPKRWQDHTRSLCINVKSRLSFPVTSSCSRFWSVHWCWVETGLLSICKPHPAPSSHPSVVLQTTTLEYHHLTIDPSAPDKSRRHMLKVCQSTTSILVSTSDFFSDIMSHETSENYDCRRERAGGTYAFLASLPGFAHKVMIATVVRRVEYSFHPSAWSGSDRICWMPMWLAP